MADEELRSAGRFDTFDEAAELIKKLPQVLTELGLVERYAVRGTPKRVVENSKRGRRYYFYEAQIRDRSPQLPEPDITKVDIAQALARIKRREQEREERVRQEEEERARYTAFGRCQPIEVWARTFSTNVPTINRYVQEFGDLETALSKIAIKKHSAA